MFFVIFQLFLATFWELLGEHLGFIKNIKFPETLIYGQEMVVLDTKFCKIVRFDRQIPLLNISLHKNSFIDFSLLRASCLSKKRKKFKKP